MSSPQFFLINEGKRLAAFSPLRFAGKAMYRNPPEMDQKFDVSTSFRNVSQETRKLNIKWVFEGRSLMTPVTFRSLVLSSLMILPMASLLPKYFFAILSVSTMVLGSFNAVLESPESQSKSKICVKYSSAKA